MTPAQRKFLKIVKDEHYFDKDSKIYWLYQVVKTQ